MTRPMVLIYHRNSGRAFTLNRSYELLEPLLIDVEAPESYINSRFGWLPMREDQLPGWVRDLPAHQFEAYWLCT